MRHREKEVKLSDAVLLLESAETALTEDPAIAFPKVQKALRHCRRAGGARCLESRCFSVLGYLLVMTGRLGHSEKAFEVSYQSGCRCCRPFIDRRYAYFLHAYSRHEAAVERAERSAADARGSLKGLAMLTLGEMRYHAGDVSGAVRDCNEAVRRIPVTSPHHSPALAALVYCMAHSERPEDVAEAFAMVPDLERLASRLGLLSGLLLGLASRPGLLSGLLLGLPPGGHLLLQDLFRVSQSLERLVQGQPLTHQHFAAGTIQELETSVFVDPQVEAQGRARQRPLGRPYERVILAQPTVVAQAMALERRGLVLPSTS